MNILVLGASGMAGHIVSLYFRKIGYSVDTLSAGKPLDGNTEQLDVTHQEDFRRFLDKHEYGAVINCIGLLVQPSEDHKGLAVYLNSYLPHYLESYYQNLKTKLIHISSDGVFSGNNSPYAEDAQCDGQSFYSRTKALGELNNVKDLTIRTSIIGPTFEEQAPGLFNMPWGQSKSVNGYSNVLWNGVTTLELAKFMDAALKQNVSGIYHLTVPGGISKYDLLQLIKGVFGRRDVVVSPVEGSSHNSELVNTRTDFAYPVSDYKTMIQDLKLWIEQHPEIYKQYLGTH